MSLQDWQIEFGRTIERHRREGWGWRYDGLDSWPTEKIFDQLRELGIDTDADRFHQQAAAAGRLKFLDDQWDSQLSEEKKADGFWQDFPMRAVPVLWERLASDLVCSDLIDEHLNRVISAEHDEKPLEDVDGIPADVAVALELARFLQGFSPGERKAKFAEVDEGAYYDYTSWLLDLIYQRGDEYPDLAAQLGDVMSDCADPVQFQSAVALSLAIAGRREEAVSRARAVLQRSPDDIWAKILAADVFEELEDDAEAIRLLLEALPAAERKYDWEAITERLEEPLDRAGRSEELQEILRSHPNPEPPPPAPKPVRREFREPEFFTPQPLTSTPKIGRNDPCPCGSGKKYKKCCLP